MSGKKRELRVQIKSEGRNSRYKDVETGAKRTGDSINAFLFHLTSLLLSNLLPYLHLQQRTSQTILSTSDTPEMNDSTETIGGGEEMELDTSMNLKDSIPKSSRSLSTAQESKAEQSLLCVEEKMDTMEDNDNEDQDNQKEDLKTSQFFTDSQAIDTSSMKESSMDHEPEADEAFDHQTELERTIKALETLRTVSLSFLCNDALGEFKKQVNSHL